MVVTELVIAIGMLLGAAYFYFLANSFSNLQGYNPGFWPKLVLIGLMVCCLFVIKDTLAASKKPTTATGEEKEEGDLLEIKANFWKTAIFLLLYILLINWGGFLIPTFLFSAAIMWMLGTRNKLPLTIISVLISLVCTLFFTQVLAVPLPRGIGLFQSFNGLLY